MVNVRLVNGYEPVIKGDSTRVLSSSIEFGLDNLMDQ